MPLTFIDSDILIDEATGIGQKGESKEKNFSLLLPFTFLLERYVSDTFSGQDIRRKSDMKTQRSVILNTSTPSDLARVICLAVMLHAFFLILPSSASAQHLPNIAGNWSGTYTCAQGLTELRLAIFQTSASNVTAIFKFSADSTNPGVPSGRYWMSGTYRQRSGKIVLRPSRWIKRPTNYVMVGLTGDVENGNASISGRVLNSGCSTFTVTRN